jgi:signal transduction histidine kinase
MLAKRSIPLSPVTVITTVLSLLLMLIGVSGAWYVNRLQLRTTRLLAVNVASMRAAEEFELAVRDARRDLYGYLLTNDPGSIERALALRTDVERWLEEVLQSATTGAEMNLVRELRPQVTRFFDELKRLSHQPSSPDREDLLAKLIRQALLDEIVATAREYLDLNERELERSNAANVKMSRHVTLALVLLGTSGSIAGLFAGFGIARAMRRSILQLTLPIRDVAGKLSGVVGPLSLSADPQLADLETVLKRVAECVTVVIDELHRSHREFIRADQLAAIGQLAAGLAHELRNPLTAVRLLVQSARRGTGAAGLTERDLKIIDDEITRVDNLLGRFLEFARPSQPERKELDLSDSVQQILHLLVHRAALQRTEIHFASAATPTWIEADAIQIRQVLLNLMLNALDAVGADGNIWVTIHSQVDVNRDRPHLGGMLARKVIRWVEVVVADDGGGLPQVEPERIFEPFFSTKETGLGLGLAICQQIVERHGGEILAENRVPNGARFCVRLPGRPNGESLAVTTEIGHQPAERLAAIQERDYVDAADRR